MPTAEEGYPTAHPPRATLSFLGAAGTVTGSRFLVETHQSRVLVDAGLFQGERAWRRRNWDPFPVDPSTIDAVVLTHAHLDHCGFLPVLARHGFCGPVWCTPDTAALAAIVLSDAAHIQEDEAKRSRTYGYSKHREPRPLFDRHHAARAVGLLHPVPFDETRTVARGMTATLRPAGHILGSSYAELDLSGTRVLFSGDLGRPGHLLLRPPPPPHDVDVAVVESTYGDQAHRPPDEDLLAASIDRTVRRGGSCLLPTFAVDRTPVVVHALHRLRSRGLIPDVPIYVDSPMALRAWEVYRSALRKGDLQFRSDLEADDLDWGKDVVEAPDRTESELLNDPTYPCIIVSASGMATGGRVLHHLAAQLPDPRNCVILTGFQVPGTRGQQLADGARSVKIHGQYVPVRADVVNLQGFSAHADGGQLVSWLSAMSEPDVVYVVHGEEAASSALTSLIHDRLGWNAVVPRFEERVRLV
jgi:metallo-beta-lactamase family protein